jgi:glyoxylase-like metal-dependent hydrolase (beta-lactamase superfamily II)
MYAARAAALALAVPMSDAAELTGVKVIEIDGAAPGELALHCAADGGTIIVGDALINFGSRGFSFLPAKYFSNHKLMRRALRKLLEFSFERMLFAHGTPIMGGAHARLTTLLSENE